MDDETTKGPDPADVVVFDALWTGVVNDWTNDERHTKFLDHARKAPMLIEAAARYGALRDDTERGEEARRRLAQLALLATNVMLASATPRPTRRVPGWLVGLCVLVCSLLLGTLAYWGWGATRP